MPHASGSKSPQSLLLSCFPVPFDDHDGCAGFDGASIPPMLAANSGGAEAGIDGAIGAKDIVGAGGRVIL